MVTARFSIRHLPWRALRSLGIGLGLVGLMLWLSGAFEGDRLGSEALRPAAGRRPEESVAARRLLIPITETFEGTVQSARTTLLSPRVGGPIRELAPRVGDPVKAGEPYGVLDTAPFEARLAVAEAALEATRLSLDTARSGLTLARERREAALAELSLARKEHERIAQLAEGGSATASELDVAVARLRRAETGDAEALTAIELAGKQVKEAEGQVALRDKELQVARIERDDATLTSEVSGVVVRRLQEPGSHALPGHPVLEVYDPEDLRLEVPVREQLVPSIDRNATFPVRIPALGTDPVRAGIVEVVPSAEEGSRSVRVRFRLPALAGLLPGMSGSVEVVVGERKVTVVPARAVLRIGQLTYVDVLEGESLKRRYIRLGGHQADGLIDVLDGLDEGETVALWERSDSGR